LFSGTCARCQKPLGASSISALDQQFHKNCFTCFKCSTSLEDGFIDHEDNMYCERCYEGIFSRPCTRCKNPLKSAFLNLSDDSGTIYPFHPDCVSCEVCALSLLDGDFSQVGYHIFCNNHANSSPSSVQQTPPAKKGADPTPTKAPGSATAKPNYNEKKQEPMKKEDLCYGCKKALKDEEVKAMGQTWHPDCFVCTRCKGSLDDGFIRKDDMPYCEDCIAKLKAEEKKNSKGPTKSTENCAACGKELSGKTVEVEDDEIYHKACFVCSGCGTNFDEVDFFSKNGKLYCEECHP